MSNPLNKHVYRPFNEELSSKICLMEDHELLDTYLMEYIEKCCKLCEKCKGTEGDLNTLKDCVYENLTSNLEYFVKEMLGIESDNLNKIILNLLSLFLNAIEGAFPYKEEVVSFLKKKCNVPEEFLQKVEALRGQDLAHVADEALGENFHGHETRAIKKEFIQEPVIEIAKKSKIKKEAIVLPQKPPQPPNQAIDEITERLAKQSTKESSGKSSKHHKSNAATERSHRNIFSTSPVKIASHKRTSLDETHSFGYAVWRESSTETDKTDLFPRPIPLANRTNVTKDDRKICTPSQLAPEQINQYMKSVLVGVLNDGKNPAKKESTSRNQVTESTITRNDPLIIPGATYDEEKNNSSMDTETTGNNEPPSNGNDESNHQLEEILGIADTSEWIQEPSIGGIWPSPQKKELEPAVIDNSSQHDIYPNHGYSGITGSLPLGHHMRPHISYETPPINHVQILDDASTSTYSTTSHRSRKGNPRKRM